MATVKVDKALFTANFKRDYVAYSAVGIFALIVLAEVVLAVSIPLYFVRSDLWDLQIARQQLAADFDGLRNWCDRMKLKNADAVEENNILLWNLNLMANYLRANGKRLGRDEIRALSADLTAMRRIAKYIEKDRPFNVPARLNIAGQLAAAEAELTGKAADK